MSNKKNSLDPIDKDHKHKTGWGFNNEATFLSYELSALEKAKAAITEQLQAIRLREETVNELRKYINHSK